MEFELENVDSRGRVFNSNVTVERDPSEGPGWYVWARTADGSICKLVARPPVAPRAHPHYSRRIRRGWLRKKDAEFIASVVANLIRE